MRLPLRILLSVLLASQLAAQAQPAFWKSPDAYLAQQPPGDTPQIFALRLLTQKDTFSMGRVAFSADGTEFYYGSNTNWSDNKAAKIRYFRYIAGNWKGPFVLNEHFFTPTFSIDGKALFVRGGPRDSLHAIVWRSDRIPGGGWTEPAVYLKATYGLYDFMPTASGICYVGSNANQGDRRDYSTYDICTLRMSPGDTTIQSLGSPVNTPGFDGDFFIARDESYLIVSAKETKDFECELYISFRRPDMSWTKPAGLGPLINDGVAHRWGEYVTPDGKYLFYSRGTSPKDCHVYWVRFDRLLETLRKENL